MEKRDPSISTAVPQKLGIKPVSRESSITKSAIVILVSHSVGADGNKPPPPTTTVTILMTMKASLPPPQDPWRQLKCKASQRAQTPLQCSSFWDRHTLTVRCAKDLFNPIVARRPELVEVGPPENALRTHTHIPIEIGKFFLYPIALSR